MDFYFREINFTKIFLHRYERYKADYIKKLPAGKHSTKGVGKTAPDPAEKTEINGSEIPYGKGTKQEGVEKTDLLYNEYIVYDVAQVNCKYLLKLKFNYKFWTSKWRINTLFTIFNIKSTCIGSIFQVDRKKCFKINPISNY